MGPWTLLAFASCASIALSFPSSGPPSTRFYRLIVFGDGYSDNGNGVWITSGGMWPNDTSYYHHSYSNGPKWNEIVAEELGLELLNYAVGGATADNSIVQGYAGADSLIPVPSAKDQIERFFATDAPRPDDVFVHWVGLNDILSNTSVTGEQISGRIEKNIDRLHQSGARNFIFANYLNVNGLPATHGDSKYSNPNTLSYNQDLGNGLQKTVQSYKPVPHKMSDFKAVFVNITSLFDKITSRPAEYGIHEKYVHPPTACLRGTYVGDSERRLCDDPERHLFFNSYHVVKGVHGLFGQMFIDAIKSM